ncbi:hypothetical protein [Mycolicibacterium llatzerense]|uniref:Uncharacterized protein n=1 Tax=Mycolicibacterium llatzerense TaxID=280871 RepID=A0A0D1LP75_9MYCO|nr:hypothetical protein [Mycolicibacterium llatzerense]KIU17891.1 hypothetical protein TL10_06445 [Mycolicibacterium llatzerense]
MNEPGTALPDAELQYPVCGACGADTDYDGDTFSCDDCQLQFDRDDLTASFLDEDAAVCGAACDNKWHGANMIKPGVRFECGTCLLPSGHKSDHWTHCRTFAESRS